MKPMDKFSKIIVRGFVFSLAIVLCLSNISPAVVHAQDFNPEPPAETVKLVFIHHSTGENWLKDGNGDLGRTLDKNNYFVSDTGYGWGPDDIGNRTDIVNWPEWFLGPESERYLEALYQHSGQRSRYTRTLADPGGENVIVMFKSCFPNSHLKGNPGDPPASGEGLTVSNAKYIYNELLQYFATRPDKLFIVITAPPLQNPKFSENARAFNTWLVRDWLAENDYNGYNVAVWDFYNILTGPENHHRFHNGTVEHITDQGGDTQFYPTNGDDHPNKEGNQKATNEFVPMLNVFYNRWKEGLPAQPPVEDMNMISSPEDTGNRSSTGLCPGSLAIGMIAASSVVCLKNKKIRLD